MKRILIIFIPLFLISCSNENNNKSVKERKVNPIQERRTKVVLPKNTKYLNMNTKDLWEHLAVKQGGCLTGGQYNLFVKKSGEGCVMIQNDKWKLFFKRDEKELTRFLISQLNDTTKTNIHTCPFDVATNGELAVYALQKIHSKNWFDFKEFIKFSKMESTSGVDNPQVWLQTLLNDNKNRNTLKELYLKELNNK